MFIFLMKKIKIFFAFILVVLFLRSDYAISFALMIDEMTAGKLHLQYVVKRTGKVVESFNPLVGKFALDKFNLPTFDMMTILHL